MGRGVAVGNGVGVGRGIGVVVGDGTGVCVGVGDGTDVGVGANAVGEGITTSNCSTSFPHARVVARRISSGNVRNLLTIHLFSLPARAKVGALQLRRRQYIR